MSLFARGQVTRLQREAAVNQELLDEVRAESHRLRTALDAIPVGIVLADTAGAVVLRNQAASRGGHADVLVSDVCNRLLAAAAGGTVAEERVTLFGPPLQVLLVRAAPLAAGGALATIDDLSDRVRLDAVRTDFVANISHELKTPVGALAVLAEALADSDDPDVNRHLAEKMTEEAHRASSTIDDLMELSRIELGGPGIPEEVELSAVLGESIARHRFTADNAGVRLELVPVGQLSVIGDRLQLVSAVSNLIDNAIKYSNVGGTVRASARVAGCWAEIEVSDDGIGIPTRDLDRVFERFYRVDRARSRDTGGTGLGLAIVRHVANNHGGDVTVRSHEGEGSTFTLRIPFREGA
ncbi:MAG: ATP-binding protein [Actinomycetota bacterium]|nr:ATP-binding protein [Actinomycetota bacterium]